MSGFYGGDTEQMRAHAQACTLQARRLEELVEQLTATIGSVAWEGPDADAFRDRWQGEVAPQLDGRGAEMRARGDELERHAEEQDDASTQGGLLGLLQDLLDGPFPPLLPLPMPVPGVPLGPGILDQLQSWASGGGATGPQGFYGDPGYGGRGDVFGQDRPVGEQFVVNPTAWDGREIETDNGWVDGYAGLNYSAGTNVTTDEYGNTTGTIGARGSAEAGVNTHAELPGGFAMDSGMRIGIESYAEAGGTVGPDGFSVGAGAGSGAYAEQTASVSHESGASAGMTQSYYVGAEAHANAYAHVTRNSEGEVNGWTSGFDASAFAGAEVTQTFSATSPGGWFSAETSISEQAGAGVGLGAGNTISTDQVSVTVGGSVAEGLGLGGATTIGFNPNAIVESISPGDYNVDDAIDDAQGAFDAGADWVEDKWPF